MIRRLWQRLFPPRPCEGCRALEARLEELKTFHADVVDFQREQIRALQGAQGAPMARPVDPLRPRPRPAVRMSAWAQSAIADGHVDIHAQRQQAERDWKAQGGGAAPAKYDEGELPGKVWTKEELAAKPEA